MSKSRNKNIYKKKIPFQVTLEQKAFIEICELIGYGKWSNIEIANGSPVIGILPLNKKGNIEKKIRFDVIASKKFIDVARYEKLV